MKVGVGSLGKREFPPPAILYPNRTLCRHIADIDAYRVSVRIVKVLSSALCLSLLLFACSKKSDDAESEQAPALAAADCAPGLEQVANAAIVTINGKVIPCSELYARDKEVIDAITAKYDEKVVQIHAVTLSELIDDHLLQAAATEAKLTVEGFVADSISAVPATDEDVKTFYDEAVASGEKLPDFEETKGEIAKFITEGRQRASLSSFRAALRAKAKIEFHEAKLKAPIPAPAP